MSVTATGETGSLDEVVDSIRGSLRTEQNRTETERDAFAEFAARIRELESSRTPSPPLVDHEELQTTSGAVALQSNPVADRGATDELATVRKAYEETVMSVPFYAAEYGDAYEESIRAEFGPDVATALTQADSLTPVVKRLLLANVERARREREALIETCDREHASVDEVATVLRPIAEELGETASISFEELGFGALEAHRTRLVTLTDKCEHAATTRQAAIHRHRTKYSLPVDAPDICMYLYEAFETAYPILALCSDLARRIETCRKQVERALHTCS